MINEKGIGKIKNQSWIPHHTGTGTCFYLFYTGTYIMSSIYVRKCTGTGPKNLAKKTFLRHKSCTVQ
jgi:hypothetical protein